MPFSFGLPPAQHTPKAVSPHHKMNSNEWVHHVRAYGLGGTSLSVSWPADMKALVIWWMQIWVSKALTAVQTPCLFLLLRLQQTEDCAWNMEFFLQISFQKLLSCMACVLSAQKAKTPGLQFLWFINVLQSSLRVLRSAVQQFLSEMLDYEMFHYRCIESLCTQNNFDLEADGWGLLGYVFSDCVDRNLIHTVFSVLSYLNASE